MNLHRRYFLFATRQNMYPQSLSYLDTNGRMEFQTALSLLLKMDFMVSCGNPAIFLANFFRLACIIPSRNAIFRKFTSKIIICLVNIISQQPGIRVLRYCCYHMLFSRDRIVCFGEPHYLLLSATYVHVKRKLFAIQYIVLIFVHSQTKN